MKISARNQLRGTVQRIQAGSVNSVVEIQLTGSPLVTAVVTNDAVADLELAVGASVCAVVKASSVLVGVCQDGPGCGGRG